MITRIVPTSLTVSCVAADTVLPKKYERPSVSSYDTRRFQEESTQRKNATLQTLTHPFLDYEKMRQAILTADPKEIAQKLHQFSNDAAVAAVLAPFRCTHPDLYRVLLFYLDLYNPPRVPNRRNRVEALIEGIEIVDAGSLRAELLAKLYFRVLRAMATATSEIHWSAAKSIVGTYPDFKVVGVMTTLGTTNKIVVWLKKGERSVAAPSETSGLQMKPGCDDVQDSGCLDYRGYD